MEIRSARGYELVYRLADDGSLEDPEGRTFARQLEHEGLVWFADLGEDDDNASTVLCSIDGEALSWIARNAFAAASLIDALDEIRASGAEPAYISDEARRYVDEEVI